MKLDEVTLNEIRKLLEKRDTFGIGYTGLNQSYQGLLESNLITHDEVQIYILLKILNILEHIKNNLSSSHDK